MHQHMNTIDYDVRRSEEPVGVRTQRNQMTAALAAQAIRIARTAVSIHLAQSAGHPSPDGSPVSAATDGVSRLARERRL